MKVKYLILGNGYMGNRFNNFLENSLISEKRIYSASDVKQEIEKYNPEVVLNCIGKTGTPNVDWCETHKIETIIGNISIPLIILEACLSTNTYMATLGTGCIYSGNNNGKYFSEEDEPNFFGSFYSRSKLYIEKILREFQVLQIRLRMPLDIYPNPKNLIDKLIKYKKIISIPNSITCIPDLLDISKKLIDQRITGVLNVVNKNPIEHKEILDMYREIIDPNFIYELMSLNDLNKIVIAERSNCVLSVKKLENMGIKVRDVKEAVRGCLEKYKINGGL